jgi:hypothetical protein
VLYRKTAPLIHRHVSETLGNISGLGVARFVPMEMAIGAVIPYDLGVLAGVPYFIANAKVGDRAVQWVKAELGVPSLTRAWSITSPYPLRHFGIYSKSKIAANGGTIEARMAKAESPRRITHPLKMLRRVERIVKVFKSTDAFDGPNRGPRAVGLEGPDTPNNIFTVGG